MELLKQISEARRNSKKRKFTQTWDLLINLKDMNLKKPEHRFSLEFMLPEGRGKDIKVGVIADSLATEAKKHTDLVIRKEEIESLAKNKKKLRKIVNDYDWFLGEAPLMPVIGKTMGAVFGPRGKLPKPVPPKVRIEPFIERAKRSVRIAVKDSPVVHVTVGTENMDDEKVLRNLEAVYNLVKEKLPKGRYNVKSIYLKLTMGKPVKLEMK